MTPTTRANRSITRIFVMNEHDIEQRLSRLEWRNRVWTVVAAISFASLAYLVFP